MKPKTVERVLLDIGTPPTLKGFQYIVDTVVLLDQPEWKDNPKWSALYYAVANLHHESSYSVERNIRTALRITRDRNADFDLIEKYIGFANCENSNSIMQLYKKIKMESEEKQIPDIGFLFQQFMAQSLVL